MPNWSRSIKITFAKNQTEKSKLQNSEMKSPNPVGDERGSDDRNGRS
jgi:hypothetical protein